MAYPYRLESLLRLQYPDLMIDVLNRGIGGQESPKEFERLERDVIAEQPDLVIWQSGLTPCGNLRTKTLGRSLKQLRLYGKGWNV